MPRFVTPLFLFAAISLTALAAGCLISVEDPGGQPCLQQSDCGDFYDCVAPIEEPEAQRTCRLVYPPRAVADAGVDAGETLEDVFWCNDVEALMVTYCAACHGEDRSGGGNQPFRLDMYEDDPNAMPALTGAQTKASRIKVRMSDFRDMPPAGFTPMPTEEERRRVAHWVRGGARLCADEGM